MSKKGALEQTHVASNLSISDTGHVTFEISEPFDNYDDISIIYDYDQHPEGFCIASVTDYSTFNYDGEKLLRKVNIDLTDTLIGGDKGLELKGRMNENRGIGRFFWPANTLSRKIFPGECSKIQVKKL